MSRLLLVAAALSAMPLAGCKGAPYREVAVDMSSRDAVPSTSVKPASSSLRFAIAAMESPADTYAGYSRLLAKVGANLGVSLDMVQRHTYAEVDDLLLGGGLDVALVCTGGYLDLRKRAPDGFEVLVVPVIDGATTYTSLVIVPEGSDAKMLGDLAGRRFAFTDPLSFSGRIYVVQRLHASGSEAEKFFGSTIYTHSHDRSIRAVADGIVDGAVVHSVIYDHLRERDPTLAGKTRVIERSLPFGMMPIVASKSVPAEQRARIREQLLRLHEDPDARVAMSFLHIERFVLAPAGLYDSAIALTGDAR
jgi:phosphonate transport system substrate-binding protein